MYKSYIQNIPFLLNNIFLYSLFILIIFIVIN